jgi:tetratricopeptide (TPR) repeat protein
MKLTPEEINDLEVGIYPDYVAIDILQNEKSNIQKTIAIHKFIMRSPELDQSIEYGEVLYELIDYEAVHNQGQELLYWILVGIAYFSKNNPDSLMYQDYFDYARGLLYKGHVPKAIEVLKKLIKIGPIAQFLFVNLINDFVRLNQIPIAKRLDDLGKKIFSSGWDSVLLEEVISEQQSQDGDFSRSMGIDDEIFEVLKEENIDFEPDYEDFNGLISIEELTNFFKSNPPLENILPFVPDMINYLYKYWEEDRKISKEILALLKNLSTSIMPEVSFLCDSFTFDQEQVFISEYFGKHQGFSLNHLEEIINNEQLCSEIRGNAGLMLMDIAQRFPERRSRTIDILSRIIGDSSQDTLESEAVVTSLVADVLDYDLYELKESITTAFNENRIDPITVRRQDFTGEWALDSIEHARVHRGRPISLTCKACGRTRLYGFNYLLLDIGQNSVGYNWDSRHLFLDQSIACTKCGVVDNYEVAANSLIGLIPQLYLLAKGLPASDELDENIFLFKFDYIYELGFGSESFGTIRQSVLSGNEKYLDPLILGEYYRVIGRYSEALDVLQEAHKNTPEDIKCLLSLAAAEHDFGDREKAKTYYKKVLASNTGDIYQSINDPINQTALSGLANLKEGERSPFPYPTNITGLSLLEFLQTEKKDKKRKKRKKR